MRKEIYCLNRFKQELTIIPQLLARDLSGKICGRPFIIMNKLAGETLFACWQNLSASRQEYFISEIVKIMKIVGRIKPQDDSRLFPVINNWQDWIGSQFDTYIKLNQLQQTLSGSEIETVTAAYKNNIRVFAEQKMQIMYYDVNFDNFLVVADKFSGIVDFERVDYVCLDYALNWISRVSHFPGEYASLNFRKKLQPQKYLNIIELFKKYYPELFAFAEIDLRLDLYSLLSDLRVLGSYPERKQRLIKLAAKLLHR